MCRVRHASNGRPNDWVPRRVKKHREVGDGPATGNGDLMKRIELTAEERRALAAATKNFVWNWIRRMRAHKSYLRRKAAEEERQREWRRNPRPIRPVDIGAIHREFERQQQEAAACHKLAVELIDAGYKRLASKLHPDVGGSAEMMIRLGEAKKRLKRLKWGVERSSHRVCCWE